LDEIYSGDVAARWQSEYVKAANEFKEICVNTLRPFETDDTLESQFYKMFEGIEVLPDSLYEEYSQVKEENPILANELVVPISWGRYHALANKGHLIPGDKSLPPIVKSYYSPEIGLSFEKRDQMDDWD
jgi:CRISPR-associated endonuclease/helicase Cas3